MPKKQLERVVKVEAPILALIQLKTDPERPKIRTVEFRQTTSGLVMGKDIYIQMASYHQITGGCDFMVELLSTGESIVYIGQVSYHYGFIVQGAEWNMAIPPFILAIVAGWQAQIDCLPF